MIYMSGLSWLMALHSWSYFVWWWICIGSVRHRNSIIFKVLGRPGSVLHFFEAIGLFKIPYCAAEYPYQAYNEYDFKLSARVLVLQISFPIAVPA